MIRASLLYMLAGFTLGALMLGAKGFAPGSAWLRLRALHVDLLLLGWVVQLAMGVAYWILPRIRGRRGRPWAAWSAFWLLNLALAIAGLELAAGLDGGPGPWVRAVELLAALAFGVHAWPRVRSVTGQVQPR